MNRIILVVFIIKMISWILSVVNLYISGVIHF